ncbi:MAG: polysaccharide biosynthesis/export family protein [Candidatus Omnitrophota bacterium]
MKRIFLLAVAAFSLAGLLAQKPLFAEETAYRIGPENLLQIDVHYGKDGIISQKVRVSSQGMINFPLVGELEASGLTTSDLEQKLFELLNKDYLVNPQVTVVIEEYSTVSIMGEVKKPGSYPIKGKLTVVELISLAEGFTKIASPNGTKVIRTNPDGSKTEFKIRVSDIVNKGRQKTNIELQAGDVVVVPQSLF